MTCKHSNTQLGEVVNDHRLETCVNCGESRSLSWPSADVDCVTCGGWGTLLRDGQRMQCECAKEES